MSSSDLTETVSALSEAARRWTDPSFPDRSEAVARTLERPNSFTPAALAFAIDVSMRRINPDAVGAWVGGRYATTPRTVVALNAGNVPLVGLQDLVAVVATGHRYVGVVSSKSPDLLPAFSNTARALLPDIPIEFDRLSRGLERSDALLATGADATMAEVAGLAALSGIESARQLRRGTRFSAAVIDGGESEDERRAIASDALLHEGQGCLNVSIVFAPHDNSVRNAFYRACRRFRGSFPPHRTTVEALETERRFLVATGQTFEAGPGFILLDGEPRPRRAGVVVWSRYRSISGPEEWIRRNEKAIQTVVVARRVTLDTGPVETCEPGSSQDPPLDWRPDRLDTVDFLCGL